MSSNQQPGISMSRNHQPGVRPASKVMRHGKYAVTVTVTATVACVSAEQLTGEVTSHGLTTAHGPGIRLWRKPKCLLGILNTSSLSQFPFEKFHVKISASWINNHNHDHNTARHMFPAYISPCCWEASQHDSQHEDHMLNNKPQPQVHLLKLILLVMHIASSLLLKNNK